MKLTLLDMTQNILSALNGEEVNSIGDTTEAKQVAECIRTSYLNMQGRYDLPEHNQLLQLQPSNDITAPVLMYRPDHVNRIEWIKYYNLPSVNSQQTSAFVHDLDLDLVSTGQTVVPPPAYGEVKLLTIEDFVNMVNSFNTLESDVESFNLVVTNAASGEPSSFIFNYKNNKIPQYFCVIQNYFIVFDSYDNTVDSTLQASKTLCLGWTVPVFEVNDSFIPDLDEAQVPLLLNEAKSLAFLELKNRQHQKAEQEVMRQLSSLSKFKALSNRPTPFEQLPSFGRL